MALLPLKKEVHVVLWEVMSAAGLAFVDACEARIVLQHEMEAINSGLALTAQSGIRRMGTCTDSMNAHHILNEQ